MSSNSPANLRNESVIQIPNQAHQIVLPQTAPARGMTAYPEPHNEFTETSMIWPEEDCWDDSCDPDTDKTSVTVEDLTPGEAPLIPQSADPSLVQLTFKINDSGVEVVAGG